MALKALRFNDAEAAKFPATASMFARYASDSDENTVVTVNQTFAAADVDTVNNQIALPDGLNFDAPGSFTSPTGVPVYFSTTGTLPSPLQAETAYILSRVSAGQFRVYPVTNKTDVFSDDFNRADENLEASPNWTRIGGSASAATVSNNVLAVDNTETAFLATRTGAIDHFVEVTWRDAVTENPGAFVCCRLIDASNFVGVRYRGPTAGRLDVYKRVGGSFRGLGSATITIAAGDRVRLECAGDFARAFVNDVQVIGPSSLAGSLASATCVGFVARIVAQDPWVDDFKTGPALPPGGLLEDTPLFAQNYMQQVNPIVLADQGAGTHTLTTDALASRIADLTGNGYGAAPSSSSNKNGFLENPEDDQGRPVFRSRLMARIQTSSVYTIHGKGFPQTGDKLAARQEVEGARTVWHTYVAKLTNTDTRGVAKAQPNSVNTTSGVIIALGESNSHPFSAIGGVEDRVRVAPVAGSLPSGLAVGTDYWVRRVSSSTFTLHPTVNDADANTNVIIPTTSPALGDWMVWAPEKPGDIERFRFFTEQLDPASGGNTLSPRTDIASSAFGQTFVIATDFTVSGSGNGRVGFPGRSIRELGEAGEASVWFPDACTPPVRQDTSQPLAEGTYWISLDPQSSTYYRLHDSEAEAIAAQGVNTVDATCIKYNGVAGSGFVRIEASGGWPLQIGTVNGGVYANPAVFKMPLNELLVVTFKIDYLPDDPATVPLVTVILNGQVATTFNGPGTKGLLGTALNDGVAAWNFLNSPQGHVPFEGDIYDAAFGASIEAINNADMIAQHTWAMSKYGIAS